MEHTKTSHQDGIDTEKATGSVVHIDNASDAGVVDDTVKASAADDSHGFTPTEQRDIIRRLDRRLVVTVGIMYCVSFMDRTNMSVANIAGMSTDLNLINNRYVSLLLSYCFSNPCAILFLMPLLRALEHCEPRVFHHLHHLPATINNLDSPDWPSSTSFSHHDTLGCCRYWYGVYQELYSAVPASNSVGSIRGWLLPELCLLTEHLVHAM